MRDTPSSQVFSTSRSMRAPRGTAVSNTSDGSARSRRLRALAAPSSSSVSVRPTRVMRASTSLPTPSNSVTVSPG